MKFCFNHHFPLVFSWFSRWDPLRPGLGTELRSAGWIPIHGISLGWLGWAARSKFHGDGFGTTVLHEFDHHHYIYISHDHISNSKSSTVFLYYHLVMTNSLPWKDPPCYLRTVNHLFLWAMASMAMLNNQMVPFFSDGYYCLMFNFITAWDCNKCHD